MKPTKCQAREKKWSMKSAKREEERKQKVKVFIAWQWPENHSTSFKTRFFQQNLQEQMG